jgi:hypothetical protein
MRLNTEQFRRACVRNKLQRHPISWRGVAKGLVLGVNGAVQQVF